MPRSITWFENKFYYNEKLKTYTKNKHENWVSRCQRSWTKESGVFGKIMPTKETLTYKYTEAVPSI